MRLLVWLVLAVLVIFAIRSKARGVQANLRGTKDFDAEAAMPKQQSAPVENMVACAQCHLYLPASEALHAVTPSADLYFCSEDHRRLHAGQPSITAE